jgi:hypothetical protein
MDMSPGDWCPAPPPSEHLEIFLQESKTLFFAPAATNGNIIHQDDEVEALP